MVLCYFMSLSLTPEPPATIGTFVSLKKGDITDIPSLNIAFENVTNVYHCAALISFDPRDEEELRKINIEGTAKVVNCCIDFGIKKL